MSDKERFARAYQEYLRTYYAPWPSDSQRQPYCQRAYRAADAVIAALAVSPLEAQAKMGTVVTNRLKLCADELEALLAAPSAGEQEHK